VSPTMLIPDSALKRYPITKLKNGCRYFLELFVVYLRGIGDATAGRTEGQNYLALHTHCKRKTLNVRKILNARRMIYSISVRTTA